MAEIEATPWNGLNVVSTFSGGGGSCLGYRMAGYRVLWASEFVAEAQRTYRANHPTSVLDTRDIRTVSGAEIREAIGDARIDLLDGSPPCSSFSDAGNRERDWGKEKAYSSTTQRTDDLFGEYVRLVGELRPRAFIAENVPGLIAGKARGVFNEIWEGLAGLGYRVEAKVLDASRYGVPQTRRRLFFQGYRDGQAPRWPEPDEGPPYTAREALEDVPTGPPYQRWTRTIAQRWARVRPGGRDDLNFTWRKANPDAPFPTIVQGLSSVFHWSEKRVVNAEDARRVQGFPDDFVLTGIPSAQYERIARSVPPPLMARLSRTVQEVLDG